MCLSSFAFRRVKSFFFFVNTKYSGCQPHRQIKYPSSCCFSKASHLFHNVLCFLKGLNGCLSRIPVCFIKVLSPLCRFNDKQQASSHILLPTTVRNWDYPGNIGGCVYAKCKATTSDCMGLALITSWKPAASVVWPNQTLSFAKTTLRSQVVTRHPEQHEAVGSECDSLLQFIHRGVQYDSLRPRPAAHKHITFSVLFFLFSTSESGSTLYSIAVVVLKSVI